VSKKGAGSNRLQADFGIHAEKYGVELDAVNLAPISDRTQAIGRQGAEYEYEFEDEYDFGTKGSEDWRGARFAVMRTARSSELDNRLYQESVNERKTASQTSQSFRNRPRPRTRTRFPFPTSERSFSTSLPPSEEMVACFKRRL
jgi:hypothetical protein